MKRSSAREPTFRDLSRAETDGVLRRNRVGRLAFGGPDGRVDIRPIHYVCDEAGDWVYGRTSWGDKLETLARNWWVAFEVDEVEGLFDWRSVVVHGGFYRLSPEGSKRESERWERAVAALRSLLPHTLSERDPVPFRSLVFGIAVQDVTGRAAAST